MPVRIRTFSLYLVLLAAGIGLARGLAPTWLTSAYHGESWSVLNRLFDGHRSHPVEYYLQRWDVITGALAIAAVLHVILVLLVGWFDRRIEREGLPHDRQRSEARASWTLIIFSLAFLGAAALSGPRHDYSAHMMVWNMVLHGGDPWFIPPGGDAVLNAYGPLFNALALLVRINTLAPKMLFAFSYLIFVVWLLKGFARRRGLVGLSAFAVAAWLLNPFAWVEVAYFGHFDILVAVACVAAVHARARNRDAASGVSLAFGVLLKYLPIVLLPFLTVEGRRIRPKLIAATTIAIAAGLTASVLVWGPATFRPLTRAAGRSSELLSIFRFLRGTWSPLRVFSDAPNVDALSVPLLLAALAGLLAWCWRHSVRTEAAAVLSVLTTLLFYKVGFEQYQIVLFLLVSYWWWALDDRAGQRRDPMLRLALAGYFGWLALFDLFYGRIGGYLPPDEPWSSAQEVVGLPTFVLGCVLLVAVLRVAAREN